MEVTADFFERTWPLSRVSFGEVLRRTEGGRTVAIINADEGKFVYKVADRWKTKEALDRELLAFELLLQKGFSHIPLLLKTSEGTAYAQTEGRFVYLLQYVGARNPEPTVETYEKLGQITAELHLIRDYPHKTEFHPAAIVPENLVSRAERLPFKADYLRVVQSLPSFDGLPEALIHTDIAPTNAIEMENGDLVLVDWDDVGVGIRVLDIAFPLIQQFVSEDGELLEDKANAFYAAYFRKVKPTGTELDRIFPAALFIALMYIVHGDIERRWKRIQWAIENQKLLEGVIRAAL
jgi:Ser/Thr protein kinase RdoA (MazF antagonist)